MEALSSIKKGDITELKALKSPPASVLLCMQAVCILLKVAPVKEKGKLDYEKPAKKLLSNPNFVKDLQNFDKGSVTAVQLRKLKVLTSQPGFNVDAMKKVSAAIASIVAWVLEVEAYATQKPSQPTANPDNSFSANKMQTQRNEPQKDQMRKLDNKTHVFVVESCENCKQHQWNTRHDQAKYEDYFNRISEAIGTRIPGAIIMRNQIPKSYVNHDLYCNLIPNEEEENDYFQQVPRTGAFEISYKGQLIFSKLQGCYWPNIDLVSVKCEKLIDAIENNSDVQGYLAGMSPMKSGHFSPSKIKTRNGLRDVQSRFSENQNTSLRLPKTASSNKRFNNTMTSPQKNFASSGDMSGMTSPTVINSNMAASMPPARSFEEEKVCIKESPSEKFLTGVQKETVGVQETPEPVGQNPAYDALDEVNKKVQEAPKIQLEKSMTPVASESSLDVSSTEPPSHQWHFSPDMDKDEFKNMVKEMFEHADENKNGVLVLSEFKQFALFALQACQGLPLANNEGEIKMLFSRFDENKDRELSWDEIWASCEPMQAELVCRHFQWRLTPEISCDQFMETVHEMFRSADENKDGVLQLKEFKQFSLFVLESMNGLRLANSDVEVKLLFERFDKNKDGELSWEEVKQSMEPIRHMIAQKAFHWKVTPNLTCDEYQIMVRQMFDVSDDNKDEVLQEDEFKQFALFVLAGFNGLKLADSEEELHNLFTRFDTNRDGLLSWEEIWESMAPIYSKILTKQFRWEVTPDISPGDYWKVCKQMFDTADENKDGVLQLDEFQVFCQFIGDGMQTMKLGQYVENVTDLFQRFDKNQDGELSWDEIWFSLKPIQEQIKNQNFQWKMTPDISLHDFKKDVKQMFDTADVNENGELSLEEFKQFSLFTLEAFPGLQIANSEREIYQIFSRYDQVKESKDEYGLNWTSIWNAIAPITAKLSDKQCKWNTGPDTSCEDFATMIEQMFNLADDNRDGVLVEDEFKQFSLFVMDGIKGLRLVNEAHLLDELFQKFVQNKEAQLTLEQIMKSLTSVQNDLRDKKLSFKSTPDMSCDDFRKLVKQMFNAADDNRDGVLQLDEFKQFSLFLLEALNGMQLSNFNMATEDMFRKFDINKDGVLEWFEIWSSVESVFSKIKAKQFSWKTSRDMSADEFKQMIKQMFDTADDNKDGVLQIDEFKQFVLFILEGLSGLELAKNESEITSLFENLDKNKDGVLEWGEIWPSIEPLQQTISLRYPLKGEWNEGLKVLFENINQVNMDKGFGEQLNEEKLQELRKMIAEQADKDPTRAAKMGYCDTDELKFNATEFGGKSEEMKILRHQVKGRNANEKQPALIYLFGGGFVIGDANQQAPVSCEMAKTFNCTVLTVDYKLSPESKVPDTALDCYAATKYIMKEAENLGLDVKRIAIGGEWSGAHLTACVCMELAKHDESKLIKFAWLDVPSVSSHWLERTPENSSYEETALVEVHKKWSSMAFNDWEENWKNKNSTMFPCNMGDELAAKCPPTVVTTREFDHFRRDAEEYASLMQKHGLLLGECYIQGGTAHASRFLAPDREDSKQLLTDFAKIFKRHL